ncbi:hypothetical protein NPIL_423291 [Nephila pilipes]|uniref:Uncharacterized protein n=1 Tax=Nephila pilipes TaxID=299642 RepID=A0A8X6MBU3_NEPPI|nr:hypothetical protein NPIL_423291 [Nephila pilipes]
MGKAAEQVFLFAQEKQKDNAKYFYNRTLMKKFQIGDLVYLLLILITNYTLRWTDQVEVIERTPHHSYNGKSQDGKIRHCYVNKVRFHTKLRSIRIIFENGILEHNHYTGKRPMQRKELNREEINIEDSESTIAESIDILTSQTPKTIC